MNEQEKSDLEQYLLEKIQSDELFKMLVDNKRIMDRRIEFYLSAFGKLGALLAPSEEGDLKFGNIARSANPHGFFKVIEDAFKQYSDGLQSEKSMLIVRFVSNEYMHKFSPIYNGNMDLYKQGTLQAIREYAASNWDEDTQAIVNGLTLDDMERYIRPGLQPNS